jgi:hypothetical protein
MYTVPASLQRPQLRRLILLPKTSTVSPARPIRYCVKDDSALEIENAKLKSHIENLNDELNTLRKNYVWVCDRLKEKEEIKND